MDVKTNAHPGLPPIWGASLAAILLVVTVAFALLPSGLDWNLEAAESRSFTEGNLVFKLQWSGLFVLAALVCFLNRQRALEVLRNTNPLLFALIAYCALSIVWSAYPIVTLKRIVQLVGMLMLGIAFQAVRMSQETMLRLIWQTLFGLQIVSIAAVIFLPDLAIEYSVNSWQGGAWRGILPQKNEFGMIGAFTMLCQLALIYESGRPMGRAPALACFLLSFLCVVMSKSTTSLLVCFLSIFTYFLFKDTWIHGRHVKSRGFLIVLMLLLTSAQLIYTINGQLLTWEQLFGPFAALLGKNTDLTGRFDIWVLIQPELARHWLTGTGYGAFWLGLNGPSQFIADKLNWVPFQAHNGYLDILNELGLVGLLLFIAFLTRHIRDLLQVSRSTPSVAAFHGTLLLFILVNNITESSLLRSVNFHTNLLLFSSLAITTQLQKAARAGHRSTT